MRPLRLLDGFLIVLVAVVSFAPTLDDYWVKDDLLMGLLTDWGEERSPRALEHYLWPTKMQREQFWRPVPILLGYAEYPLYGTDPRGYRIGSLLLHGLNALLLAMFVARLTGNQRRAVALVAGLAAAVSPVNVEVVGWVLQRMILLSTAFSLLALLAWLKAAETGRHRWRVFGLIALTVAILSKETAVVVPGLFFLIDMFYGPPSRKGHGSLGAALRRAIIPAALLAAYLGVRYTLWGRLTLSYAGMEPLEYAAHNRVFERLPSSLLHVLAPVNASLFDGPWLWTLRIAFLAPIVAALFRAPLLFRRQRAFRRGGVVLASMGALALGPVLLAFWVTPELFNARFFYVPGFALHGLIATALWLPYDISDNDELPRLRVARLFTFVGFCAAAIALAAQIQAWGEGAHQVRAIQTDLLAIAQTKPAQDQGELAIVTLDVPSVRFGVPTLETHLDAALRLPLGTQGVRGVALLSGLGQARPASWAEAIATFRSQHPEIPWENYRYARCEVEPPGVIPAFPVLSSIIGVDAPTLVAPQDGQCLTNLDAAPTIRFRASQVSSWRLVIQSNEGITLNYALQLEKNVIQDGEDFVYEVASGDFERPETQGQWTSLLRRRLGRPVFLVWRIERLNAEGKILAASAERRLAVFDAIENDQE